MKREGGLIKHEEPLAAELEDDEPADGNREQLMRSIRPAVTSVAAGRFNVGGCRRPQ